MHNTFHKSNEKNKWFSGKRIQASVIYSLVSPWSVKRTRVQSLEFQFFSSFHILWTKTFGTIAYGVARVQKKKPVMGLNDDFEPFGINNLLSSEKKNIDLNIQFMWHFQWKYLHLGKILKRISNYCISDLIFYVFFAWNANRIGLMFHALQSYCTIFFLFVAAESILRKMKESKNLEEKGNEKRLASINSTLITKRREEKRKEKIESISVNWLFTQQTWWVSHDCELYDVTFAIHYKKYAIEHAATEIELQQTPTHISRKM